MMGPFASAGDEWARRSLRQPPVITNLLADGLALASGQLRVGDILLAVNGAACASGSLEVSGVLGAMGVDPDIAAGSLRFSFARDTSEADVEAALEIIADVLASFTLRPERQTSD